jgi:hypothetical protein
MRGPLLSGPLGSQPTLEALLRLTQIPGTEVLTSAAKGTDGAPVVVLGPP